MPEMEDVTHEKVKTLLSQLTEAQKADMVGWRDDAREDAERIAVRLFLYDKNFDADEWPNNLYLLTVADRIRQIATGSVQRQAQCR